MKTPPSDPDGTILKILTSAAFQTRWAEYHHSARAEYPILDIMTNEETWARHGQDFAQYLGALLSGKPDKILRRTRNTLPKSYKAILDVIERYALLKPLNPKQAVLDYATETGEELKTQWHNHRKAFSAVLATEIVLLAFMSLNIQTAFIQPVALGLDPVSGEILSIPLENTKLAPTCHDHIRQLMPPLADFLEGHTIVLPQHCTSFLKDLTQEAQQSLEKSIDFIRTPYEFLVQKPLGAMGETVGDDSKTPFMKGFKGAAETVSDGINQLNIIENFLVHGVIALLAFHKTRRLGTRDYAEWQALRNEVVDMFHRALSHRPLSLVFAGAVIAGNVALQTQTPDTIWAGLGAGAAGYVIHDLHRRQTRPDFIKALTHDAPAVVSHLKPEEKPVAKHAPLQKKKPILCQKFAVVSFGMMNMSARLDPALTAVFWEQTQELSGALTGVFLASSAGLSYMMIDDIPQHWFFAATGMMGGGVFLAGKKSLDFCTKKLRETSLEPDIF